MRYYSSVQLKKYPHMSPGDIPIWNRFLAVHFKDYDTISYDVPVGEGIVPDMPLPEEMKSDYVSLTRKRIDAVGFARDRVDIIEVKPRAATTALGQIITYTALFRSTHKPTLPLRSVVITDQISKDDEAVYKTQGITVIIA